LSPENATQRLWEDLETLGIRPADASTTPIVEIDGYVPNIDWSAPLQSIRVGPAGARNGGSPESNRAEQSSASSGPEQAGNGSEPFRERFSLGDKSQQRQLRFHPDSHSATDAPHVESDSGAPPDSERSSLPQSDNDAVLEATVVQPEVWFSLANWARRVS